jgi:hypothetical protein
MSARRRKTVWLGFVVATVLGLVPMPARAAEDDAEKPFEEPGIVFMQRRDPYVAWIAGALMACACLFIAFKNPHRSHLD